MQDHTDINRKPFRRETIPNMKRRCLNHDYRSISYYMITLAKNPAFPHLFCRIFDPRKEKPDFTAARKRSAEISPGIKRILIPENGSEPSVELSDAGALLRMGFRDFFKIHTAILLKKIVVMPDHVHFIIHVREYLPDHLGHYIGLLKVTCTRCVCDMFGYPDNHTAAPFSIFEENYHDRIIRTSEMLETERRYLDDNPRRYFLRKIHPEYFHSPVKITIGEHQYAAFGNILLLKKIHHEAIIVSSKYSARRLSELETGWKEAARENKALVSPFISKAEKSRREEILNLSGNIIEILDNGFPERYKPAGRNFDLCLEGRLLQIAPLTYNTSKIPMTRKKAWELNDTARKFASLAHTPAIMKVSKL